MKALTAHAAIYKTTIAVHPSKSGQGHYITFKFDSTYDCQIGIYLCAVETIEPGAASAIRYFFLVTVRSFKTSAGYPEGKIFKFKPGKGQTFPEGLCEFNLNTYKKYLTSASGSYFPLVLRIVGIWVIT
eukprot:TRINITY_DN120954_c1_g1_i1.p6 TRINITY_DN120954_c1_g1~~TRINITY_DN120954_c1_g1_i1.p6  ORF type:complete len:129 (+),score=6.06 TRINITY_DN120954_c1_g1_i1:410-796(+)